MVSTDEIFLQRPKSKESKAEETEASIDSLSQLANKGGVLMVCRTCGKKGDHWTSKCPYKDLASLPEISSNRPSSSEGSAPSSTNNKKNNYIPPSLRAVAQRSSNGFDMKRRNDENTVRVTCISEDTSEADLIDLFSPFGQVSRAYVAIDRSTGLSRGFGFVSFIRKEDAQRAIEKLDGYGYDNLILHVGWSK